MRKYLPFLTVNTRKPRTLAEMRKFLKDHPRRMGWIGEPSDGLGICHNVKISRLHTTRAEDEAMFRALDTDGPIYDVSGIGFMFEYFTERNPGYHIVQAGRSQGYFVLQYGNNPVWANDEDLEESANVRELAKVVWDFDQTCNDAVGAFVEFAMNHFPESKAEPV